MGAIISRCVESLSYEEICATRSHAGRLHAYHCRYIIQIGQPDSVPAPEGPSPGLVETLVEAACQARETGADGVEIRATRPPLSAQLLGPGTSDRPDRYQGSLENPALLLREVIQAIRSSVGWDFHLQVKLSVNCLLRMMAEGARDLVHWLEKDGVDAIHVADEGPQLASAVEGAGAIAARFVKYAARINVLRNGRFHAPEDILEALGDGSCDVVTLLRPMPKLISSVESASRRDPQRHSVRWVPSAVSSRSSAAPSSGGAAGGAG